MSLGFLSTEAIEAFLCFSLYPLHTGSFDVGSTLEVLWEVFCEKPGCLRIRRTILAAHFART